MLLYTSQGQINQTREMQLTTFTLPHNKHCLPLKILHKRCNISWEDYNIQDKLKDNGCGELGDKQGVF